MSCRNDRCIHHFTSKKGQASEIIDGKVIPSFKAVKMVEAEQRYIIGFFTDEGLQGVGINSRRRSHYDEDAVSRTQGFF
jgi:hypothetical protein